MFGLVLEIGLNRLEAFAIIMVGPMRIGREGDSGCTIALLTAAYSRFGSTRAEISTVPPFFISDSKGRKIVDNHGRDGFITSDKE